jgi:hypothetical protein
MSLNLIPRKLIALNINDEAGQIRLGRDQHFISFQEIDSYIAAQELLLAASDTTDGFRADLFLIDVNFGRSEIEPGLEWAAPGDLRPFGPLLALPFFGREMAAFVPYSNYWGDESVHKNGYVLVTISLLFAITTKEIHRLSKVRQLIKNAKTDKGLHSTATSALNEALSQYRQSLETSDFVELVDVKRTLRRLEALEENMADMNFDLPIPLQDAEGILSIDFAYPPFHLDSIELSSLFADALGFTSPSKQGDFTKIYDVLERWGEKSTEVGGNTLAEAAKKALARVEGSPDDDHNPLTIKEAVNLETAGSQLDKYSVRRIAIEFAWVQAWYDRLMSAAPIVAKQVRLESDESDDGDAHQQPSGPLTIEQPSLISMVQQALGVDKLRFPAKEYPRLLSNGENVSKNDWRTAFKREGEYSGLNDAYQLDQDGPAALSSLEKAMCRQYAQDVLDWDGSNRFVRGIFSPPYPRWMV